MHAEARQVAKVRAAARRALERATDEKGKVYKNTKDVTARAAADAEAYAASCVFVGGKET